jgi:hypothetical protein
MSDLFSTIESKIALLESKITDINYRVTNMVSDISNVQTLVTNMNSKVDFYANFLKRKYNHLKKLLLFKVEEKLMTLPDDYISTLQNYFRPSVTYPPIDYASDPTPAWMIAEMIIAQTDAYTRTSFEDMFRYLYDKTPQEFFVDDSI